MTDTGTHGMGLAEAARAIADGTVTSRKLVDDCLGRIETVDGEIAAWAHVNPEKARAEADRRDELRKQGKGVGPLHGVPIGIKDIIDTAHMPTERGCALHAGRVPFDDAWVVSRLRNAGAVILGKTDTAELAACGHGKARNPHNTAHTPGGSSSGSAAAVASYQVPGALGTQTGGSVIRPASFCGVYGFKPTYGMIPRSGIMMQCPSHDQVGTFARSIEDTALLAQNLFGYDAGDDATSVLNPAQDLRTTALSEPPIGIRLGFAKTPMWDRADDATRAAFEELCDALGDRVEPFDLPPAFEHAWDMHRTIVHADNAKAFAWEYEAGRDKLAPCLRELIEGGRAITAVEYLTALEGRALLQSLFDEITRDVDAIITPAATGEAPEGFSTTGDPVFCALWSLLGVPAISLPLMVGENELPVGVQLVGRFGDDARLLRTANWLVGELMVE